MGPTGVDGVRARRLSWSGKLRDLLRAAPKPGEFQVFVSKAEYRVKADFAQRNLENIKAFLPLALERLKSGASYSVSVSKDGQTFLHVFIHQSAQDVEMLGDIPAFQHFLKEVMEGCEAPPSMSTFIEI